MFMLNRASMTMLLPHQNSVCMTEPNLCYPHCATNIPSARASCLNVASNISMAILKSIFKSLTGIVIQILLSFKWLTNIENYRHCLNMRITFELCK